jgi:hypothetical protein
MHAAGRVTVERHALHGRYDIGDIDGIPGLVTSVKFVGKGAPMDLSGWLNELQLMRDNLARRQGGPRPDGILVVRRAMYPSVSDWYAVERWADWWQRYSIEETLD